MKQRMTGIDKGCSWVLAAAITLGSAGCATTGGFGGSGSAPLTPAEQRMREDNDRFNSTVIGGALMGAAVGGVGAALIAKLSGASDKKVAQAAAAGAVVGGTVGGMDGYSKAKLEKAGRNEVRAVESATADMKQDNAKLQAFLDSSGQVLAEGQARLDTLRQEVAAKKITTQQAEAARKREERNIASMNETLAQARKTRDQYAQAATNLSNNPKTKRDLDEQIGVMNKQIAQLEQNVANYNQALKVSRA